MRFNHFFIIIVLLMFCTACEDDEGTQPDKFATTWTYLGLGEHNIQEVKIIDNTVFAATRDGMFKKSTSNTDTLWQTAGLEGMEITDFVAYSSDEMLASFKVSGSQPETLYETTDGGMTWAPLESNFGGEQNTQTCRALEKAPADNDVLFGRGDANVAKSTDGGLTWESTYQEWNNIGYQADLIVVDENNPDIVWAGGETSIFSPYIIKSTDRGESWLPQQVPNQGDNAVYSMAIHPDNSERILVGMEGQIIHTTDGGENWEVNFTPAESSYVHDIQNSLMQTGKVFATGTDGGTSLGDIIIFVSDDFGGNWETIKHEGKTNEQYGAVDMALLANENEEFVYVGTNRGVFVYTPEPM